MTSKNYTEISHWIERVIQSSTHPVHEQPCLKLIELFTASMMRDRSYQTYGQLSHHLYKTLFKKFLFNN